MFEMNNEQRDNGNTYKPETLFEYDLPKTNIGKDQQDQVN